jgi:signal transduction histidine kinase
MAATALAMAVAWLALTLVFERHIERREAAELREVAALLVSGLGLDAEGRPLVEAAGLDPRFDRLASGRYWQVSAPWRALTSRSLWDQSLPAARNVATAEWRTRVADGPFDKRVLLVERVVRLDPGGPPVLVQVAQNEATLSLTRREFGRELALFLTILWLFLAAAAWLQVDLGLRPLMRLRERLEPLRANPAARLDADFPREIEPLTSAINQLAEARESDLARARKRAADLAHGLKTPLAALAAQSRRARESGAAAAADGLDQAIAAVASAVEAELARSRLAFARGAARPAGSLVRPVAERVASVVQRTEIGERLEIAVETPPQLVVPVASDELAEILGALLENAARFARHQVRVSGTARHFGVTVEDDGPGIDAGRSEAALIRGGRLDEAGPGHGLGLAIVAELVDATGGEVRLDRSSLGGLRVTLQWPPPSADSSLTARARHPSAAVP